MMRHAKWIGIAAIAVGVTFVLGGASAARAEEEACPDAKAPAACEPKDPNAPKEPGFVKIFNGKDLTGWEGDANFWSVQDGAIVGQTTKAKPTRGNTFLIWKAGKPADFELRMKFKLANHNSGIQFRSRQVKGNYVVAGYQADFDGRNSYTGMIYEEKGRGIMARRGTKVVVDAKGKKKVAGKTCTEQEFKKVFKAGDWNDYTIAAKGNELVLKVNGLVTSEMVDNHEARRAMSGILALQLHAGPPMKVQFKDIRLKTLGEKKPTKTK
jgi:hypothetical protein